MPVDSARFYRVSVVAPSGDDESKTFLEDDDAAAEGYARYWSAVMGAGARVRLVRIEEREIAAFTVADA